MRVYYADTDVGGVVYYANYLKYLECGRTEYLREKGVALSDYHKKGFIFAVTEVNIKYRAPARYDDEVTIETQLDELSSMALVFKGRMYNQSGVLLNTSTTKLVCINERGRAARIPEEIKSKVVVGG